MAVILLIEDDRQVRDLIVPALIEASHTVIEAEDGLQGERQLMAHRPDLVITDIVMPEKDGIETILHIRRKNVPTKVIAMSGGGSLMTKTYLEGARSFGVDGVLAKPFRIADLMRLVDDVLGRGARR